MTRLWSLTVLIAAVFVLTACQARPLNEDGFVIDDSEGYGRRFDGIGGLSGGGATSRLLPTYTEDVRDEILDILFKPNYGASLHILKVEIGGDAQSTDGTESSHMHFAEETPNYQRGYEWWLMKEAKKRNPSIKLYGLPWAFPGWVGNGTGSPYTYPNLTASYVTKWVEGAKTAHNLTIDYVGIWNERSCNYDYIHALRSSLDDSGFKGVKIVGCDGSWPGQDDYAIDIFGAHYPGTNPPKQNIMDTGKPLWASEDYSTFNDLTGGGCWARILNQNYVNGNMTATISWNLIASYYQGLPFTDDGLMTAREPWSGHFVVSSPIWGAAHTTHFAQPGHHYLKHGSGAGHLNQGGSYVTLVDPSKPHDLTIVIEKMSHDHSRCIRPPLPPYETSAEDVTFELKGSFSDVGQLYVWKTQHNFSNPENSTFFELQPEPIKVSDGKFTVHVPVDSLWTLTSTTGQVKGNIPPSAPSQPFPAEVKQDLNNLPLYSEADLWTDQAGVWEIRDSNTSRGHVMRQVVPEKPICWSGDVRPLSIIGDKSWAYTNITTDALVEKKGGALVGGLLQGTTRASGVWFGFSVDDGSWGVWTDISDVGDASKCIKGLSGSISVKAGEWHKLHLFINGTFVSGAIDQRQLFDQDLSSSLPHTSGFAGIGTYSYDYAMFDNMVVQGLTNPPRPPAQCAKPAAGQPLNMQPCANETDDNQLWTQNQDGSFSLASQSDLCVNVGPSRAPACQGSSGDGYLCQQFTLEKCSSGVTNQTFVIDTQADRIKMRDYNYCFDILNRDKSVGALIDAYTCGDTPASNQNFVFNSSPSSAGRIQSSYDGLCVTACASP